MAVDLKKILFDDKNWLDTATENTQLVVLDGDSAVTGKQTRAGDPVRPVRRLTLGRLLEWLHSQNIGSGVFPSYMGTHASAIDMGSSPVDVTLTDDTAYCTFNGSNGIMLTGEDVADDQYYTAKVTFTSETTGAAQVNISGSVSDDRVSYTSSVSRAGQFTADVLIVNLLKTDTEGLKLRLSGNGSTVSNIRVSITYLPQKDRVNVDDLTGILWTIEGNPGEETELALATNNPVEAYLATN